jgi:hypothetical protein
MRTLLAGAASVGIYASLPTASETNPTTSGMGQFVVKRIGPTTKNITVGYYAGSSSTAHVGVNYRALTGSVTIKRGRAFNYVNIVPIDDNVASSDMSLVMVLRPMAGVALTHSKATVTIHDTDSPPISVGQAIYISPTGNDNNPGTLAAPFKTLTRARDFVRTINQNMTDEITVFLRGGEYAPADTLTLDQRDSGTNGFNVTWSAYAGEKPVITGAVPITGWTAGPNGVFSAPTGGLDFLQLYVNGKRATLARTPDAGNYHMMSWNTSDQTIDIDAADAAILRSLTAEQLHQVRITIPGKGGNQATMRIASISGSAVTVQEPERTLIFNQVYPPKVDRPYFLDTALAFLDSPGEFYVDPAADRVYYKPRAGENMPATAVATAPRLQQLLHIEGTLDSPVHNIVFSGLTFQQTTWTAPMSGFLGDQGSFQYIGPLPQDQITSYPSPGIPAAVDVRYSHNLRFERNTIRDTGASAVNFWIDVDDTTFIGNRILNSSASGLTIDLNLEGNPTDARKISTNDVVKDNFISGIGLDYYQSVGIMTTYAQSTTIEHNEVTNTSYTGISVGWGWSDIDNAAMGNVIRFNKVHDVLKTMADGAGIYTLSRQWGTVVEDNYIYDITRQSWHGTFPLAAIYLDEGSNQITVQDNVIQDVQDMPIFRNANGPNDTLSNNDGASPTTIANAGVELGYRDIVG